MSISMIKDVDEFVKGFYDHRTWKYEIPSHEWDAFYKKLKTSNLYRLLTANEKPNIHYDTSKSTPSLSFMYWDKDGTKDIQTGEKFE